MRIGILTQRLHTNYGGLLQCFALLTILKSMGFEVEVLQRVKNSTRHSIHNKSLRLLKQFAILLKNRYWHHYVTEKENDFIAQETKKFISKYINPRSPFFYCTKSLKDYVETNNFGGYIVGSDQVWRPCYSPCISNYFLDFAYGRPVKKVSYAASFGVDIDEYTPSQKQLFSQFLKEFDAISVREVSGIELCDKCFGVKAKLVLDPTFLIDKSVYENLIFKEDEPISEGNLFCYILDNTESIVNAIKIIENEHNLMPFKVMPKRTDTENLNKHNLSHYAYPSVTKWLRAFLDAKMVVTDSFHGCVFSIIFNKPFWVMGNKGRGLARFHSLLSTFGLEDRLLSTSSFSETDWMRPINWDIINSKLEEYRLSSLEFLQSIKDN